MRIVNLITCLLILLFYFPIKPRNLKIYQLSSVQPLKNFPYTNLKKNHDPSERLRLPVQAIADRQLRSGQVLPSFAFQRQHLQRELPADHRGGLQDPDLRLKREDCEAPDLGHCGSGAFQDDHQLLL